MTRNPELQRQIWLNWSPAQLLWSLGLSALVLALPLVLSKPLERATAFHMTALIGLWLAATLYGSALAARSLSEEAHHNTWDWQRLSALSPWQMAWGKLLGATLPAWLYTLWFALALLAVSAVWATPSPLGLHTVALAVLWGLALQTWAMGSVLMGWGERELPTNRRRAVLLPLLMLLFIPGPFLRRVFDNMVRGSDDGLMWWSLPLGGTGVTYLFGAALLGLGLLALWRQLCTRLDVRTLPWAWPLGLAVAGFLTAGSFNAGPEAFLACTLWLSLLGTVYAALQYLPGHLRNWRQVQWSASRSQWRQMLEALPLWPVSWLLALLCTLALPLWPSTYGLGMGRHLNVVALLLCLQLLRDCLILTGFSLLVGRLKSPLAAFCMAWLVINVLLPLLAYGLLGPAGATAVQPAAMMALGGGRAMLGTVAWVSLGLQLLLASAWVVHIFRDRVLGFARDSGTAQG
jgi:hypothetical protein